MVSNASAYSETLTASPNDWPRHWWLLSAVILLMLLGGAVAFAVLTGGMLVILALAPIVVAGAVFLLWAGFRQRVDLDVDDNEVAIHRHAGPLWPASTLRISMTSVAGVAYTELTPSEGHIYVQGSEPGAQGFMVDPRPELDVSGEIRGDVFKPGNVYRNGVRIERHDGPPVYLGSAHARELASAIAGHAPDLEHAERWKP